MGYDYSRSFLDRYEEDARQLLDMAKAHETRVFEGSWDDVRIVRRHLLNVMMVLKVYAEQDSQVLTDVRTWTQRPKEGDVWRLFIGFPDAKLRGRRGITDWSKNLGVAAANTPVFKGKAVQLEMTTRAEVYRWMVDIMGKKKEPDRLVIEFLPGLDSPDAEDGELWDKFRDTTNYQMEVTSPTTVVFTRPAK